ncbi:hypothetical protein Nepgr_018264 [Nepenthes gracilis]|uniref:Uncharacterized protein n=1 Tax=Nepenthes gracilis TaxID=150966 RepID=A0AAD3XTA5_NEPGR|nr:hypothetical protein Nepgr_018264 [Nepenthes gracilis]
MKFMKIGSKKDTLQSNGKIIRYVATELMTDIVVSVGDVKFYLHKFPLLSKSSHLQKLVASTSEENGDEVCITDIPGGPAAFEICVKFCYGIAVTLNAHNVVAARCAAEYLGMHETIEKGNLVYKIDVFLNSSIFRSWKDTIIALQSTKYMHPWSEELKLVSRCVDSIASRASVDSSKVDWSYTCIQKKLPRFSNENGNYPSSKNGVTSSEAVPKDWWVEELCELDIDLYKLVIASIKEKGKLSSGLIGEALKVYAYRKLPTLSRSKIPFNNMAEYRSIVNEIIWLLPTEKGSVSCSFMLKLLKAAVSVDCGEQSKCELMKKIAQQLEDATVNDLLIRAPEGETMMYDVDTVKKIVLEFLAWDQNPEIVSMEGDYAVELQPWISSEASKLMVANMIDAYLAEIARDPNLMVSKFVELAETVSGISRAAHDGLYRAIDVYLKEHPGISKSERKWICRLMDCKKLSADTCIHAVQNERFPLRVIAQVLFFEQVRAAAAHGATTPELPQSIKDLKGGSSRTTNVDEDWDAVATAGELRALKSELAALRSAIGKGSDGNDTEKTKMKGLLMFKKIFAKLWSGSSGGGETSGSDSPESADSANHENVKSPFSTRRTSIS